MNLLNIKIEFLNLINNKKQIIFLEFSIIIFKYLNKVYNIWLKKILE